jgi:hypothetical protein
MVTSNCHYAECHLTKCRGAQKIMKENICYIC